MAVKAALKGHGVALLGEALVSDHLAAGRLARPFRESFSTPLSFSAFRNWLLKAAASP